MHYSMKNCRLRLEMTQEAGRTGFVHPDVVQVVSDALDENRIGARFPHYLLQGGQVVSQVGRND